MLIICIMTFAFTEDENQDGYFKEYIPKLELIKNTEKPRIIFVGGSNLAFGLDSKKISEATHKNVINDGLHAGIGLKLMIDDIDKYLQKGDTVVVCPEYNHFFGEANGDNGSVTALFMVRPQIILNCDATHICHIAKKLPKTVTGRLLGLFINVISKENVTQKPLKTDTYRYCMSGFNEYGDEVSHLRLKSNNDSIGCSAIKQDFDESFYKYFIKKTNKWNKRGIDVIMLPPAIYDKEYYANHAKIKYLTQRLSEDGLPFKAPTDSFAYPKSMMYDTSYHINKEGVAARTQAVIQTLAY